jgi:hypothetical protein
MLLTYILVFFTEYATLEVMVEAGNSFIYIILAVMASSLAHIAFCTIRPCVKQC